MRLLLVLIILPFISCADLTGYTVYSGQFTWSEAANACKSHNMEMAEITSETDFKALVSQTSKRDLGAGVWVGGRAISTLPKPSSDCILIEAEIEKDVSCFRCKYNSSCCIDCAKKLHVFAWRSHNDSFDNAELFYKKTTAASLEYWHDDNGKAKEILTEPCVAVVDGLFYDDNCEAKRDVLCEPIAHGETYVNDEFGNLQIVTLTIGLAVIAALLTGVIVVYAKSEATTTEISSATIQHAADKVSEKKVHYHSEGKSHYETNKTEPSVGDPESLESLEDLGIMKKKSTKKAY